MYTLHQKIMKILQVWMYTYQNSLVAQLDKESTCKAGDPWLIPGSGRSPEEGIGYPLQYSWASLAAQVVKNPPGMQETSVQSLDWKDPLEAGMTTQSSILAWRIPMDRGAWRATVHGVTKSETQLSNQAQHTTQPMYVYLCIYLYVLQSVSIYIYYSLRCCSLCVTQKQSVGVQAKLNIAPWIV